MYSKSSPSQISCWGIIWDIHWFQKANEVSNAQANISPQPQEIDTSAPSSLEEARQGSDTYLGGVSNAVRRSLGDVMDANIRYSDNSML